ncbi:hypothetical protein [Serratia sp. DD3]|uniref:hypothetical protein n=1 Tax=Serratia sp. DD3 TaxID=1410619 RepID=UPI0004014E0F|nr:hypothetical protein [Serratia sp. DD3]
MAGFRPRFSALSPINAYTAYLPLSLSLIEANIRSAAMLFLSVPEVYAKNMRLWHWKVVIFITLLLVAAVMIMGKIYSNLRNKFILVEGALSLPKNKCPSSITLSGLLPESGLTYCFF